MLKIYTLEDSTSWDELVNSFKEYDVYWLSGYVKAFSKHGDGEPLLFYLVDGGVRAINVVMKRDIGKDSHFEGKIELGNYYDFVTPYGYGGWLVEGLDYNNNFFDDYNQWCFDNNVVSEFVRYHPVLKNNCFSEGQYYTSPLGDTVAIDLSSPQQIWENFTGKNRNMIRKAIKENVKIYNGRFPEIYETFQNIYNSTMDKNDADSYYYFEKEFYESILNDLDEEGQIFYAELNGNIISAAIMLSANGKLNYHLSGSDKRYNSLAPSNLLLYKAALWGYANGCKTFHLGGGVGSQEDSLYKFKKSFYKGEPCKFYIGKKIHNIQVYEKLCKLRNFNEYNLNLEAHGFFPEYRKVE